MNYLQRDIREHLAGTPLTLTEPDDRAISWAQMSGMEEYTCYRTPCGDMIVQPKADFNLVKSHHPKDPRYTSGLYVTNVHVSWDQYITVAIHMSVDIVNYPYNDLMIVINPDLIFDFSPTAIRVAFEEAIAKCKQTDRLIFNQSLETVITYVIGNRTNSVKGDKLSVGFKLK